MSVYAADSSTRPGYWDHRPHAEQLLRPEGAAAHRGIYNGPDAQDRDAGVPHAERQAVGETTAPAFDFDGDPRTPATMHHPIYLTENGLRTEPGLPLRPHYAF